VKIDIGGGVRLFVDIDGLSLVPDGPTLRARPTIVLVHGGPGSDHTVFLDSPLGGLTDVAQLVYYDQRGQGRSDGDDPAGWTLDTWADDIVRLCDALGIEHPIVLGASFGGFVVQHYLARHPEHPAKVVLAGTRMRLEPESIGASFERLGGPDAGDAARRFWSGDAEAIGDYVTHCMPLYRIGPPDIDALLRTTQRMEVLEHFQRGEQHTMDLEAGLANARCPVLVLSGELDPICPPEESERIVAALPSHLVTFHRLAGAAHVEACGESADAVALVRDFVTS
jgi:proline iminopeptidase